MYNLPAINSNISKGDLNVIAESTINEIINNKNATEVIDVISKMEYLIKQIRSNEDFINYVRGYISLHGNSLELSSGTKMELAEVGVKYDYSNCNDDVIENLLSRQEEIEDLLKQRQLFLRSLPLEGMELVTIHGELKRIYPPSKSSTSSFKVTLKK